MSGKGVVGGYWLLCISFIIYKMDDELGRSGGSRSSQLMNKHISNKSYHSLYRERKRKRGIS